MMSFRLMNNLTGWLVFAVTFVVYYFSVESTGSLWDCGEFIAGADKLQVVHPPGAPLFLMLGKLFTLPAHWFFPNQPEAIAVAVNLMSAMSTAFAATFVAWVTTILSRLGLVGREGTLDGVQTWLVLASGLIAGLATGFSDSIWFSAVEGEVYALSLFFTTLTLWAVVKWYALPDDPQHDRWLVFAFYSVGLSIGVHLLSILTLPALALFYYFKKYEKHTLKGMAIAFIAGVVCIGIIQKVVISGIPWLWSKFDVLMVNSFGLPFNSGVIPLIITISALLWYGFKVARDRKSEWMHLAMMAMTTTVVAYSIFGMVVIRAIASPPINMNNNVDPLRLLVYLNREQYGERPLLNGPHFLSEPEPGLNIEYRYTRKGDKYEKLDPKIDYNYDASQKMLFPRLGHTEDSKRGGYLAWLNMPEGVPPTMGDNIGYFFNYQLNWMFWRYFMWNFAGRQNGSQGLFSSDVSSGHWISGIGFLDKQRLYDLSMDTESRKKDKARNKFYFLPLLFGLLGLYWQFFRNRSEFLGLLSLFLITGIGIIIYTNQPPLEPRERDYVLVGAFFTFCIWIGMGVISLYESIRSFKLPSLPAAALSIGIVAIAPLLMAVQGFDDHSRRGHYGARDYARNFLESCAPNSILFTYGDNDTYPLWYAQEVEGIRTDVRVVNLSLIAVDWYIELLRRKVNNSPAIKFTIPAESYYGTITRSQIPLRVDGPMMSLQAALKYAGESHEVREYSIPIESSFPSDNVYLDINKEKALKIGIANEGDSIPSRIAWKIPRRGFMTKDHLAVLDIIASNFNDRPIYFATTCPNDVTSGLGQHLQLEGLATRFVVKKFPSNPSFSSVGLVGAGGVNDSKLFDNFTKKFNFGGFDKKETHISQSYDVAQQMTMFAVQRGAYELYLKGRKDSAVQMIVKYFQGFPNFNFPFDFQHMSLFDLAIKSGGYEKVKPQFLQLAKNCEDNLRFMTYTIGAENLSGSLRNQFSAWMSLPKSLEEMAGEAGDSATKADLEKRFKAFKLPDVNIPEMPQDAGAPPPQ